MTYAVAVLAVAVTVQTLLLWRVWRAIAALGGVTEHHAQIGRSLRLLTETTETGFASFAGVLSQTMRTTRRPKATTARARTLADCLADDRMRGDFETPAGSIWQADPAGDAMLERGF